MTLIKETTKNFLDTATAKNKNQGGTQQPESSLAKIDSQQLPATLDQASPELRIAQLLQASGLFPNAGSVAGVFTIVQFGKEVGLSPVVALNNVNIIKGKLSMQGASMLALAFKYGVKAKYLEETEEKCTIRFTREGFPDYVSTFTYEDAKKAGLLEKRDSIYHKYLKTMLKWRSVSQGMKMIAPDILAGVYTEEEINSIEATDVVPTPEDTSKQLEFNFVEDVNDPPPEKEWHPEATGQASAEPKAESGAESKEPNKPPQPELRPESQPESTSDAGKGTKKDVEKVTAPQLKKLHVMATQSGLQSFMSVFKMWLVDIEGSGLPPDHPSGKDLNKDFCSKLIGSFEKFSTLFFASPANKAEIINVFATLKEPDKKKILKTIASYLEDMSSVGEISIDKAEYETLSDYLGLFLTALENQEHNKIADGGKKKGLTVEQVLETLRELGFNPEVKERIELNTKTDRKPVEEPPPAPTEPSIVDDFDF